MHVVFTNCIFSCLFQKENPAEAIKAFVAGINLFYSVAVPPHRDTHIAQESLRVCFSAEQ